MKSRTKTIGLTLMALGVALALYLVVTTFDLNFTSLFKDKPVPNPDAGPGTNFTAEGMPTGWTETKKDGVNWSGVDFVNPADTNQKISYVNSRCAGCPMDQDKFAKGVMDPDPFAVLPSDVTQKTKARDGMSASYVEATKPYETRGILHVLKQGGTYSGYETFEVTLPPNQQALAQKLLDTFHSS
ncbi:hypothetical protein [Tumebacillus permanentifrigoris]|uniref:Uncharacterized protein n=1 Tax=Tumebacillus permanentifrigoris TaxID=378543 RepID=A0A316D962_9BACL|nr:hypothetical protein [Tumebacillus permanentifrigoris]PWK13050.1 hypothetical protein C7459_10868 [Tumebacillus permanentifrigoris]